MSAWPPTTGPSPNWPPSGGGGGGGGGGVALLVRRGTDAPAQNYISDNFTRANSNTTAGSTNSYAGGTNQAWTASGGSTWGISANELYCVTGTGDDHLTVPAVAYADVRATVIELSTPAGNVGLVAGYVDANNFVLLQANQIGSVGCYKRVAGTYTALIGPTVPGYFQGGELRLRLRPGSGSNTIVEIFVGGVSAGTITTALGFALGTKAGFRQDVNGSPVFRVRDFQVAAAGYSVPLPPSLARYGVVLAPAGDEFEILNPTVFWDTTTAKWWMNYSSDAGTGHSDGSQLSSSMASATSLYGPWTRSANNPVLVPGAGEGGYATDGSITKLGSTYFFYYQDFAANIRYATASVVDGPYTKQGIIANLSPFADCFTRLVGGNIEWWAEGPPGAAGAGFGTTQGIYYSTSPDGTTWPVPSLAFLSPWYVGAGAPNVYNDAGGGLHCYYCDGTNITGGPGYKTGRVTAEAVSPSGNPAGPWIQRPLRLGLGAAGAFDDAAVFDAQPILASADGTSPTGNQLFVLYSGSQNPGLVAGLAASCGLAIGPDWPA